MGMSDTVLIIPPNDPEAVLISRLADTMGLPVIRSRQGHGASLDKEKGLVAKVKKGRFERAVIVEMPGPKTEGKLREAGVEVVIIDHHQYTGLDRAHDAKGRQLPSSMEQFLKRFRLTDARLRKLGFDPKLVRGIGIVDRAYVWGALEAGYSWRDVRKLFAFQDELMADLHDPREEAKKMLIVENAWKRHKEWNGYAVVETDAQFAVRPRLSRVIALDRKRPVPLILVEKGRGFIYVQESPKAYELFEKFGGFTFGEHQNWGYENKGARKPVALADVKRVLV